MEKKEYPPSIPFFRSPTGKLSVQVTEELVALVTKNLTVGKVLFLNLDESGERKVGANVTFFTPKPKDQPFQAKAPGGFKAASFTKTAKPKQPKSEEAPDF